MNIHTNVSLPFDMFVMLRPYVSNVAVEDVIEFSSYAVEMFTEHGWPLASYGIGSGDTFREFKDGAFAVLYNRTVVMKNLNKIMEEVNNSIN